MVPTVPDALIRNDADAGDNEILEALKDCDSKLRALKKDDRLLEKAEEAFRQLAETIDTRLRERRITPERRVAPRESHERRQWTRRAPVSP